MQHLEPTLKIESNFSLILRKFGHQHLDSLGKGHLGIGQRIPLGSADIREEVLHLLLSLEYVTIEVARIPIHKHTAKIKNDISNHSSLHFTQS